MAERRKNTASNSNIRTFEHSNIRKSGRAGFTIIELLVVIVVIGILGAIVTSAAAGALRNARGKRASMMCTALEQGIAAYYAQEGKWPDKIESVANGSGDDDADTHTFSPDDTDAIFYQVVGKGFGKSGKKSVLVDATALFVANRNKLGNEKKGCCDNHDNQKRSDYCGNKNCIGGEDFTLAVAKSGKHHIRLQDMAYGYQGQEEGKFCRFWITYNRKTDSVSVSTTGSAQ